MSNPGTWAQVQAIFHEALERPAEARDLFLAEACLGDASLEAEVRSLLASHEDDGMIALLDDDASAATPRLFGLEHDQIGPYRILRPLGQGGMGMVFLAAREEHDVTQTVALKLLRLDFVDPALVERFRAERRILARLEHPGIARLITAGATDAGQPFFAMEFVEGTSLLEHCRRSRCTLDERLGLFLEVCDAVEYAHQQLVVHRDLKPGNILVTEEGRAKLLDFGVAKLIDAEEAAAGTTRTGGWFTPEYASPEQLRRQPVTTLSDVYALGVGGVGRRRGQPLGTPPRLTHSVCFMNCVPPPSLQLTISLETLPGVMVRAFFWFAK
jgi:serine/threonine protein kinase